MASMNSLYERLQELIVEKEYKNKHLQKEMIKTFGEKGLSINTPMLIFGENLAVTELSQNELICFTKTAHDVLQIEILNPNKYFSQSEIINYENYINMDVKSNIITLDRVFKDINNKLSFTANYVPIEYLASLMNDRLIRYNHETQREATYRKGRNNKVFKEITLNRKSVNEIAEEMIEGIFPTNEIVFNVLLMDDKVPQIHYDEDKMRLEIVPNLDFDSDNTTVVDCIDGWHRLSASLSAVIMAKEKGIQLKSTLHVRVEMKTLEEAKKEIIRELFKRNPTTVNYIESLKQEEYEILIDDMMTYASRDKNIFYNNIAKTIYEKKQTKKIITGLELNKVFKDNNIKIKNVIEMKKLSKKLCKIVTDLYDMDSTLNILEIIQYAIEIKDTEGINKNSDEYLDKLEKFISKNSEVII